MSDPQFVTSAGSPVINILCGTFTSIYLYILSFHTSSRTLTIQSRIPAHGPHQYLALSPGRSTLYATSWAWPPSLYAFELDQEVKDEQGTDVLGLDYVGKTPITAISSYITIHNNHIYSIGGPTGEVHTAPDESSTNGFGNKVQEVLFVDENELDGWDKTNKALRYGAHGIEFDKNGRAYIPDLGTNSIWVYSSLPDSTLELIEKHVSPREGDSPRHAVVSKDDKCLYAVTEHTQFVDVYDITERGLEYVHSASLIPEGHDPHDYRGDTIRTSPSTPFVFATTRGKTSTTPGYLCAYALDPDSSHLRSPSSPPAAVYQTPTSGGKANAIEVIQVNGRGTEGEKEWIVLTDDEEGWVVVISWDGIQLEEVTRVKLLPGDGASHAVWLE